VTFIFTSDSWLFLHLDKFHIIIITHYGHKPTRIVVCIITLPLTKEENSFAMKIIVRPFFVVDLKGFVNIALFVPGIISGYLKSFSIFLNI